MNLTNDFTQETISLLPDYEGEVIAVLTSAKSNQGNRKSVLYIHGYVDYFFHPHVAESFDSNDFDFYALDLRKYGRSLLKHQHPNYCKNIEEYYEEITLAIQKIKNNDELYLFGHSTGGLIASNYMNFGKEKNNISGLILNSPFLDFNQPKPIRILTRAVSSIISAFSDFAKIEGVLPSAYAESIHKDYYGEWDFDLNWKPIKGFPTYFKWIHAIAKAHRKLNTSNIHVPVLVMHSSNSLRLSKYEEKAKSNDIVLNIKDIKKVGKDLGDNVTMLEINQAIHDIFLSEKEVRQIAFDKMFDWIKSKK